MGYYIRILSPTVRCVSFSEVQALLASEAPSAVLTLEAGTEADWEQLVLAHHNATEIAAVERSPVDKGSLGAEELEEFREEITDCAPASAVEWLLNYFSRVRTIYTLQVLSGTETDSGWEILGALKTAIWRRSMGIFQADGEGFSNEQGYHILWQFSDSVSGPWWMGVLREGSWVHFEMELGDSQQKQAFLRGEVPTGVRLA